MNQRVALCVIAVLSVACQKTEIPKRLDSPFSMADHSMPFANFAAGYDASEMTPALMERMFGSEVCQKNSSPCELTQSARAFMKRANRAMGGGRCEGFAVLSSLFEAGKLNPADFGGDGARELKLQDNPKLQAELAYWFSTQLVNEASASKTKQYMAKDLMPALVEALKKGATDRWRLGMVRKKGTVVSGGHAMTPMGFYADDTEKGVYWVRVYDNNNPDAERKIKVDTVNNRWEFEASENPAAKSRLYYGDSTNKNPLYLAPVFTRIGTLPCDFCTSDKAQIVTEGGVQVSTGAGSGVSDGELGSDTTPSFTNPLDDEPASFIINANGGSLMNLTLTAPYDPDYTNPLQSVEVATREFTVTADELLVTKTDGLQIGAQGGAVRFENASRTDVSLRTAITLADGGALALAAVVRGGSDGVSATIDRQTGKISIGASNSEGALVTMVVTSTDDKGEETSAQLSFVSNGDGGVTADTSTWSASSPLEGTINNNGVETTVTDACTDGKKSGMETDVDCGSVCTTKCLLTQTCNVGADCDSTFCHATTKVCVASSCGDGRVSGNESDVDCGGATCGTCALGKACVGDGDCASTAACIGNVCVATWAVGVSVTGVPAGDLVVLRNNGSDSLSAAGDGSFAFTKRVAGAYDVTILTQPSTATCTVANGSGTATADVSNVQVSCTPTFALGGTVTGLSGSQSVTIKNGSELLTLSGDGSFQFNTRVSSTYSVTVDTQPTGGVICVVTNGSGTATADVSNLTVTCAMTFAIGGTLSGLPASQSVILKNGAELLTVSANGTFQFLNRVTSAYAVTVDTQPATAVCGVTNESGTASADVTNVTVTCTPLFAIGGTLSGLPGAQSVVLKNGAELLTVSANGPFQFLNGVTSAYAVTVDTQPATAVCIVTNDSGTASADVTNVTVTCSPQFSIAGLVTGLPFAEQVVLQNNGADDTTVFIDGPFAFMLRTPGVYAVTVKTQPASARCTVSLGSGTATADVSNVVVSCAPSGVLDPTFNGVGWRATPFVAGSDFWVRGVMNPDDSMVLAGQVENGPSDVDWVVSKIKADGTPDTAFGTFGHTQFGNGVGIEYPRALFRDASGRYVVIGGMQGGSEADLGIARLTATGSLDPTFADAGIAVHDVGQWEYFEGAVEDSTGGYVVVGRQSPSGAGPHDVVIGRVTSAGALDTGFGSSGWVVRDLGSDDSANAVAIDSTTQDILVAVASNDDTTVLRYTSTGSPVGSFGTGGAVTIDMSGGGRPELVYRIVTVGTNMVLVGRADGVSSSDLALVQLTSTGTLDSSFGTGGRVLIDVGGGYEVAYAIVPAPSGGWYIGGHSDNDMVVGKLSATGALDTSFATGGLFLNPLANSALAYDLMIDSRSFIVGVGTIRLSGSEDLGICRLTP